MRVVILKLKTGETLITRLAAEDPQVGTLVLEKPYLVEHDRIYPWLYASAGDANDRVEIHISDLLLKPMSPKEVLLRTYLEHSSGLTIPTTGGSQPPTRGGGVPPNRGGGVPPTRGGGPTGPVQ